MQSMIRAMDLLKIQYGDSSNIVRIISTLTAWPCNSRLLWTESLGLKKDFRSLKKALRNALK